jgi:hypothetical protein
LPRIKFCYYAKFKLPALKYFYTCQYHKINRSVDAITLTPLLLSTYVGKNAKSLKISLTCRGIALAVLLTSVGAVADEV